MNLWTGFPHILNMGFSARRAGHISGIVISILVSIAGLPILYFIFMGMGAIYGAISGDGCFPWGECVLIGMAMFAIWAVGMMLIGGSILMIGAVLLFVVGLFLQIICPCQDRDERVRPIEAG